MKPSANRLHVCAGTDDDGQPLRPEVVTCGICGRSWCERCDPAPSALCHYCHGRGYSEAPMNRPQVRRARERAN